MKVKKILSAFIAATMVLSTMSFTAFATDSSAEPVTPAAPTEIVAAYEWYTTADAEATEYEIDTVADLAGLAKITQADVVIDETTTLTKTNFAGKTVKLAKDIEFADNEYWYYNDGTDVYDYRIVNFAGTLDGQDYTIRKLNFLHTEGTNQNVGLFSKLAADGAVKNLTFETVTGTFGKEARYGTVAATLDGDVNNCHLKNINITVNAGVFRGAALGYSVGNSNGCEITGCTLDGFNVVNSAADGVITYSGLLGTVKADTKVTGCTVDNITLDAKSEIQNVGGLMGLAKKTTVMDCSVSSIKFISGYRLSYTGGLVGQFGSGGASSVENCTAENITISGAVLKRSKGNGEEGVGGFVGAAESGTTIENCSVSNVSLTATEDGNQLGGFVGNVNTGSVIDCSADVVNITISGVSEAVGAGCVGGFAGQTRAGTGKFDNCILTNLNMVVKENAIIPNIGGFVGNIGAATTVTDCSVSGSIEASNATLGENFIIGGFTSNLGWGQDVHSEFTGCTADVDITAKGTAGGFLGISHGYGDGTDKPTVTIKDSTATGDVTSTNGVAGGFVAICDRGTYENCIASGNITSNAYVAGGFLGTVTENVAEMEDKLELNGCEAHGKVSGSEAGGLVGTIKGVTPDDFAVESETGYIKIENCNDRNTVVDGTTEKHYFANLLGNPTVGYLSLETAIADAGENGGTITIDDENAAIVVEKNTTEVTQGEGITVGANAANTVINDKNNVIAAAAEKKIIELMTDAAGSTTITVARKDIVKYEKHATDNNKIVVDIEPTLTINGADVELDFKDTDVDVTVKVDSALNGAKLKVYHEDDETTPINGEDGTEVINGQLTFTTNKGFSEYTIEGVKVTVGDEAEISEGIKVVLEKTDSENKYLLKLVSSEDGKSIYRFTTAEMKFNFETTDNLTYTVTPAAGIGMSTKVNDETDKNKDLYLFNADSTNIDDNGEATITKGEITLATVEFNTYGTFTFNVQADAKVQGARELTHSNKKDYTVATNNLEVKIDKTGTEAAGDAIIDNITLAEKKELMTIELICDNFVENKEGKDYQDMTITIERVGNTSAKKVIGLYNGQDEQTTTDTDIKSITHISSTDVASKYVVAVELPVNYDYTITLSGAGYRTYTYKKDNFVAPTTLRFWNDEEHKFPEEIEIGSGKTFVTTFLAGDIIEDTKIDIYDLNAVVSYWGTDELVTKYPDYNKYDLNRDGKVDQTDVTYVLLSWGY